MVSKFEHCLNDLLFRARIGELPIDIVGVVSNHPDHRGIVEWHGIPFFHVPVTADTKPEAEERLLELVDEFDVELVVLARYMQVLSDDLTRRLDGRAINIHHSFLPSFKGAKPYHQAYARGVKTVGATAHYVNAELDEGPIISQQVVEVDHTYGRRGSRGRRARYRAQGPVQRRPLALRGPRLPAGQPDRGAEVPTAGPAGNVTPDPDDGSSAAGTPSGPSCGSRARMAPLMLVPSSLSRPARSKLMKARSPSELQVRWKVRHAVLSGPGKSRDWRLW